MVSPKHDGGSKQFLLQHIVLFTWNHHAQETNDFGDYIHTTCRRRDLDAARSRQCLYD